MYLWRQAPPFSETGKGTGSNHTEWILRCYRKTTEELPRVCRGFISFAVSLSPTADEIGNWDPTISCHMSTQCLWHEPASWGPVHIVFKHSIHPWGRDQPLSYYAGFEKDKAFLYMGPSWKQLSPTTIRKASPIFIDVHYAHFDRAVRIWIWTRAEQQKGIH